MKSIDLQQPSSDHLPNNEQKKYTQKQVIAFIASIFIAIMLAIMITSNIISNQYEVQLKRLNRQIDQKRKNQKIIKEKNINYSAIPFPKQFQFYDPKLKDILKEFYLSKNVETIADFGCGRCKYIIQLHRQTQIKVEGYQYSMFIDVDFVYQKDLSQPVNLGKKYDYIQSFEVGQHIFQQFQANFLDNIAKHANTGIILGWAVMGSEGYLHVNNRDNDYIIKKVEALGFKFNKQQTEIMKSKIESWLKDDLMIFDRKNKTK